MTGKLFRVGSLVKAEISGKMQLSACPYSRVILLCHVTKFVLMKFLPGFSKGSPESNDPFGGHYRREVLNAPIIPITIWTGCG